MSTSVKILSLSEMASAEVQDDKDAISNKNPNNLPEQLAVDMQLHGVSI